MRLIHLTDIHLSANTLTDFKQFYLKALINDLKAFNNESKIDLILITGDLCDKGGTSFIELKQDPYEIFNSEFVDPIADALNIDYSRIYICPGNHDINENSIEEIIETGILHGQKSIESVNSYLDKYIVTTHDGLNRTKEFKKYERNLSALRSDVEQDITNFGSNHALVIDDVKIGISCINSSWRCSTKLPKDSLTIGTRQLLRADSFNEFNSTQLNIVLMHHPLNFISSIEQSELENHFQSLNFDVLLCGHIHSSKPADTSGPNGAVFVNVAKSAFGNPREKTDAFKPGYCIIDIVKEGSTTFIKTYFRKYIHNRLQFDKDVDTSKNGENEFKIVGKENSQEYYELVKLTSKTCQSKLDNINTSLLIYGTDSIAPRDLNELFVLPSITDSESKYNNVGKDAAKDEKFYSIEDIILLKQNVLIIGDQESGKTTFLNKFFLDLANRFSVFNFIPVKLNYSDLVKKELKPLIKDFLNEPSSDEIDNYLSDGKIYLIIDEFTNTEKFVFANAKLKKFIREFPKNRILLSTSVQLEELITEDGSIFGQKEDHLKSTEFKPLFLGPVGVKQFKELSIKWFKRKDSEWLQLSLEKLIKVFQILKTPRTFFSVSLFLWIIEKQESFRPVNKANLVNRFLILILKGLRIEESEAGKYTYEKKVEILRELAFVMYTTGDSLEGYSLPKADIIACIKTNFTLNQLKLDETEKYDEFFEKGLLKKVNGNDNVAFRYEAFFQYFLSLNIDKNPKFKSKVFHDDHFLSFIDELDYYTGNSRDDKETLTFAFKKLEESFEEIDKYMVGNLNDKFPTTSFLFKKESAATVFNETKKHKYSDREIEDSLGRELEMLPVSDSIRVKESIDSKLNFHKVLELAARVLKNSENIQDPSLINTYLDVTINKSAKHGIFMQSIIADNIEKHKKDIPFPIDVLIIFAPIGNQDMLIKWLGTDFLELPLENKIKSYLKARKNEFSEYELFLTVFLYFDLKLSGYIDLVDLAIDKIDNLYIHELFFIKISHYYLTRPSNSSLLPRLEALMVKLLSILKNISKKEAVEHVDHLKKDRPELL